MRTYQVTATPSSSGWQLNIEREGTTHARTLDDAERQVRYYLTTLHEYDYDRSQILITVAGQPGVRRPR